LSDEFKERRDTADCHMVSRNGDDPRVVLTAMIILYGKKQAINATSTQIAVATVLLYLAILKEIPPALGCSCGC